MNEDGKIDTSAGEQAASTSMENIPATPSEASRRGPASPEAVLRLFVEARDVQCPLCSYNLRDAQSQQCPECGVALELRLGGAESHLRQWLVSLLVVAVPAGFFAIVSLVTVYFSITEGMPSGEGSAFIFIFWMLAMLYVGGTGVLLARRRHFLRLNSDARGAIVQLLCIFSPLLLVIYMLVFLGSVS